MSAQPNDETSASESEPWSESLLDRPSLRLAEQASRAAGIELEQWLERVIHQVCAGEISVMPVGTGPESGVVIDQPSTRRHAWRPLIAAAPPLMVIAGFAYLTLSSVPVPPRPTPAVEVALPPLPAAAALLPTAPPAAPEPAPASTLETQEPSDPAQLARWLEPRAQSGDALAGYRLGTLYLFGTGVPQDYARAAPLLRAAAEGGIAEAQFDYARLCETGDGVPKDAAEAVTWYRKAAAQDNVAALLSLGYAYAKGFGVARSMADAAQWFRRAAELGGIDAQYNLAFLYEHGEGVTKSAIDAYAWYAIAGAGGDQAAKQASERLARDLPAKQLLDAILRMTELKKSMKTERAQR